MRALKSSFLLPGLLSILLFATPFCTRPGWAQGNDAPHQTATEFAHAFDDLSRQDPAAAVQSARQYVTNNPQLDSTARLMIYGRASDVALRIMNDDKLAGTLVDEALQQNPSDPYRFVLVSRKATLLKAQSLDASDAFLKEQWPLAEKSGFAGERYLFQQYSQMLKRNGKSQERVELTRSVVLANLEFLGDQQSTCAELVDALLQTGQDDEALGWAKLNFIVCPYDDKSIRDAAQLLVQIWTAHDLSQAHMDQFTKAQQDAAAPNPLAEVKNPNISPEALTAATNRLSPGNAHPRITLLLLGGQTGPAMLEARRALINTPSSALSSQDVCRVFKAADLNLIRANAFLEYYKTGQGENPMAAFLKDALAATPAQATP